MYTRDDDRDIADPTVAGERPADRVKDSRDGQGQALFDRFHADL
jgi:hypothetical protein